MTFEQVMTKAKYWFFNMEMARYRYDYEMHLHYMHRDYGLVQKHLRAYEEASQLCQMLYALARTMRD